MAVCDKCKGYTETTITIKRSEQGGRVMVGRHPACTTPAELAYATHADTYQARA